MKKCTGGDTTQWGFDAIFDIECPHCGNMVEFFKDEIKRKCKKCRQPVINNRKDYGCNQWCSANSEHARNLCSRFKRSKEKFYGRYV